MARMVDFLNEVDLMYAHPARADNVYIAKMDGERKYLSRQYRLWILRGSLLQGSSRFVTFFLETLTFSQLYDFVKTHKQFI